MRRLLFPAALLMGALIPYLAGCSLGAIPDAAPVRDPAVEARVADLERQAAEIDAKTAERAKALEEKVASGVLTAEQAAAMKASDAANAERLKAMADALSAANARLAAMDSEIKARIANLPRPDGPVGIAELVLALGNIGMLLAARASAKKEVRKKIAEFDAAPESVQFMADGTIKAA